MLFSSDPSIFAAIIAQAYQKRPFADGKVQAAVLSAGLRNVRRPTLPASRLRREAPETDSGWIYVVVTAYTSRRAHGVLIGTLK